MTRSIETIVSRAGWRLAQLLIACAVLLGAAPAYAGFNQATCNTLTWDTAVPTNLGALEFIRQSTSPAGGAGDMTLYNHNTNTSWTVVTNSNVSLLRPSFGYFVTELNYDSLTVLDAAASYTYTGSLNTSTTSLVAAPQNWNLSQRMIAVAWNADSSVASYTPPNIAQVQPRCKSNQSASIPAPVSISENTRIDGLLIKTGDVIYFSVQQQGRPMVITVDPLRTTGSADFDLYVGTGTNTAPDDANHQFRSYHSGVAEALVIPAATRTLYIGVRSYAGAGHFALNAASTTSFAMNVCATNAALNTRVTLTATQRATLGAHLRSGAAHVFGYTNGNMFQAVYTLNTTWTGSCSQASGCDICAINDSTNTAFGEFSSTTFCGRIRLGGGVWGAGAAQGQLYAHEAGHACFNLPDEYQGSPNGQQSPRYCGHTTVANNAFATGFCALGHCLDGQVSDLSACNANINNWQQIKLEMGAQFRGEDYGAYQTTPNPTPTWNNAQLRSLVTLNGF